MVITDILSKRVSPVDKPVLIYRDFCITHEIFKSRVDQFYEKLETREQFIVYDFLKTKYSYIDFSYMPFEYLEKMLYEFSDANSQYYIQFQQYIAEYITPFESLLTKDSSVLSIDMSGLNQFTFWLNLVRNLFVSVIHDLLAQIEKTPGRVGKAKIVKKLYTVLVRCSHLFYNKYGICQACSRFYYVNIYKLIRFANEGAEFALYAFAMLCPEMIDSSVWLLVINDGSFYNHPDLAISEDDPTFGLAREKFYKYY